MRIFQMALDTIPYVWGTTHVVIVFVLSHTLDYVLVPLGWLCHVYLDAWFIFTLAVMVLSP